MHTRHYYCWRNPSGPKSDKKNVDSTAWHYKAAKQVANNPAPLDKGTIPYCTALNLILLIRTSIVSQIHWRELNLKKYIPGIYYYDPPAD